MNTHTRRILIVDDDPLQVGLLRRQILRTGIAASVEGHTVAAAALASLAAADAPETLVMLDLNMPDTDGIVFLRRLAEAGFEGGVVLVSGENERIIETAARLAAAYCIDVLGSLVKPVPPSCLQAMLRRWQEGGRHARTASAPARGYTAVELARAIAQGQLLNHYQPKVDLRSGAFAGVEALVRWQHPEDGLVFPDAFIPGMEASGLIDELTRGVLLRAAADLRALRAEGLRIRLAINVSMDSLDRLAFPELVCAMLDEAGLAPAELILELTESRLGSDPVAALDILARLRLRQIGVSIDDFGTGHSSLRQLRDLPFDELKIDRGFVTGARKLPTRRAIFCGCLDMARELNIHSVAEGVEDRDDWEFVRASGCDQAQGYFISRPIPAAELPAWHARWQQRCGELIG